jgi:uncharacterized Tic20 family protein
MLAENAGINLRTLQRIEKGNTIPRGETLRFIAAALDVPVEDLSENHVQTDRVENKWYLELMSLSALSFWFIPLGNILLPFVFWIFRKDLIDGVGQLGKRILYFQVIWSLIAYGPAVFIILTGVLWRIPFPRVETIMIGLMVLMALLYIANSAYIVITTRRISRKQEKAYSLV